jgi:hypothetical protein
VLKLVGHMTQKMRSTTEGRQPTYEWSVGGISSES